MQTPTPQQQEIIDEIKSRKEKKINPEMEQFKEDARLMRKIQQNMEASRCATAISIGEHNARINYMEEQKRD